jgi:pyruvate-ferredoxin/flavodoxin oxidoreductase
VGHTSLALRSRFSTEIRHRPRPLLRTRRRWHRGRNKNSIKIIGEDTANYAQGYFVYDSKKSGSITTSHLRFGPKPIRSSYLITRANFVACHQFNFLERIDVLRHAEPGASFLLNSPFGPTKSGTSCPAPCSRQIIAKKLQFYVIDGYSVAKETGMGQRINTVMQTCFFAISGVLPREEAIDAIKHAIKKTYGKRGEAVVQKNFAAVDATLATSIASRFRPRPPAPSSFRPPVPAQRPPSCRMFWRP